MSAGGSQREPPKAAIVGSTRTHAIIALFRALQTLQQTRLGSLRPGEAGHDKLELPVPGRSKERSVPTQQYCRTGLDAAMRSN